ncbi:Dehydrogenase reductase SDR member 1, partial [Cichlidogyrus casuarinus]
KGVAVPLDHNDETQISNLFARMKKEQQGRLDVFVNNAFSGVGTVLQDLRRGRAGFWDLEANDSPGEYWDRFNQRSMLAHEEQRHPLEAALIVGANIYLFNPAYTAGKAATDKMSADIALELRRRQSSVAVISLWPGPVDTEQVQLAHPGENDAQEIE